MFVFRGTIVHSKPNESLEILPDYLLGINGNKIVFVESHDKLAELKSKFCFEDKDIDHLRKGQFLLPGFIDAHIHAAQYPNAGVGLDLPLLKWLHEYTFPLEAEYANLDFAKDAYERVVETTLRNGTTTACYFASSQVESTLALCDIAERRGQRALVGKVCMDCMCPEVLLEEASESLVQTERFIKETIKRNYSLVTPVITPRFAVSCSKEQMTGLGDLAKTYDLPIQTHISENRHECETVKELFPECDSYTDVYKQSNLLTSKSILAHGIYLSDKELSTIKKAGSGIVHCPNSNISICSGLLDVQRLKAAHVKTGLGTDVSGGYSSSMLNAMRYACLSSKVLAIQGYPNYTALDWAQVFHLATLGSAQVLGLEDSVGNFETGKQFDALVIDCNAPGTLVDVFDRDSLVDVVEKFFRLGDDRNIKAVYVAGRKVV